MERLTRLTVIAPGFRRGLAALDATVRLPVLERLVARGRCGHGRTPEPRFQSLESWQLDLARVLPAQPLPSAPVSALGAGLAQRSGTWLHAQFLHVAAGLDHLVLVPLRDAQALDETTLDGLRAALAQHVQEDGYEWLSAGAAHFLRTDAPLQAETCAPDVASHLPMVEAMPRGSDGARLRRLMTELQMQLHDHPLNRQRERAGLLPANSVWLWGAGALPAVGSQVPVRSEDVGSQVPVRAELVEALLKGSQSATATHRSSSKTHLYADDCYARGLARLHDLHCQPLPRDGAALLDQAAANTLVLLHCASLTALDADWLAPVERALNRAQLERLELILDDIHITADRCSRWRLWRRTRPLTAVIA